jgi:Tol biopolymer transport system component
MKKTIGTWIFPLVMMGLFLLVVVAGCKKEQDKEWPEGLNGRFLLSKYDYVGTSIIYSMDENGVKRLFSMDEDCISCGIGWVKWAPDGSRFLYETGEWGLTQTLYIVRADGTEPIEICESPGTIQWNQKIQPVWSPDSKKIVFVTWDPSYISYNINSINSDGSGNLFLAKGHSPVWSPDMSMIAFVNGDSLYQMNSDGSSITVLAKGSNPCWSLDGLQIYIYNNNAIWSLTLLDNSILKLADLPEGIVPKYWSPARDRIICLSGFYGDFFILNVANGNLVQVSDNFGNGARSYTFCWSQDGTKIAYTKENNNPEPDGLFVMNADGSNSIGVGLKWLEFAPNGLDWR